MEKFRCYIEYTHFTLVTDCYALKWLHSLKDPLGRLGRWVLRLQNFNFNVIHRPGKDNVVPDCLSRDLPQLNVLEADPFENVAVGRDPWYDDLKRRVLADPLRYPKFRVTEEKLYKKVRASTADDDGWKLVVPVFLRRQLLQKYHDDPRLGGHFGVYKTYNKLTQHYIWPQLKHDVVRYIRRCKVCASVKPDNRFPPGLMGKRPAVRHNWQMISCDLFGPLPRSKNGYEYVLAVIDYVSKFPIFIPMKQATAQKVIAELEEKVILVFGVPEYLITDNGVQFGRSRLFNEFLENYGIKPYYNNLYTPQNNPTERLNRTMKTLIMSYLQEDQRCWDENLSKVACALRTAKHEATRYTPYFVNFGREMITDGRHFARLRDQAALNDDSSSSDEDAVPEVNQNNINRIRQDVVDKIQRYREKVKSFYDRKRRDVSFAQGDLVWKRDYPTTDSTKHFTTKLAKRFKGPYRIQQKIGSHTYVLHDPADNPCGRWHTKDLKIYQPTTSESEGSSEPLSSDYDPG